MANSLNTTPLGAGQSIRDYRIQELCHEGRSATTYRATHERLGRDVSLRVYREGADAETREQLKTWARGLVVLRHRNLAELTDFGFLDDDRFYCAWGWIAGVSLADPVSLPKRDKEFSELIHKMCAALDALHEAGLAHGAIGPEAFLVHESQLRLLCPSFAAREAEHAEDIRALGKVIFQLLSRRETIDSDATQNLRARGEPNPALSDEALATLPTEQAAVIAKCLADTSSERFQNAQAVARALDVALDLALDLPLGMALDMIRDESEPAADVLKPGDVVGESYRVTGLLGRGGMGQVYEAVHTRLPQRVAIKVIAGDCTEEALARFRREAEISSSLGHPHIVSVYDFNTLPDGKPYMVMEFLKGENLGTALKRGAMDVERVLLIAEQLGSALAVAHDNGIVHRDLKPANIFLSQVEIAGQMREHATILDFGISKREDNGTSFTHSEAIIGTPQYMAPEQAKAENDQVGAASDQFALAAIVYEMLTGQAAFGRGTLAEIVYRVCHTDPPAIGLLMPALDRALAAAIERAMSKRREQRFDSVAQFVAALTNHEVSESAQRAASAKLAADSEATQDLTKASELEAPTAVHEEPEEPRQLVEGRPWFRPVLLGVGALACAGLAFVVLSEDDRATSPVVDMSATNQTPETPDVVVAAAPTTDAAPRPVAAFDAAFAPVELPSEAAAKRSRVTAKPGQESAQLDQAEELLAAGRYRDARKLVQTTPFAAKTARGYAITVKSYCGEGNFGAATDWLARVPRKTRSAIRAYCLREHAIKLD